MDSRDQNRYARDPRQYIRQLQDGLPEETPEVVKAAAPSAKPEASKAESPKKLNKRTA